MSLQSEQVRRIAYLARLAIDEQAVSAYASDLSAILELVEQMNAVDTRAVLPMAHPLDMVQRLRADVVAETDQSTHFQSNAPSVGSGLYLVPKVIE